MTTILFSGGGSGGHLFPGVAVAGELAKRELNCRIVFVGSDRGLEKHILEERGLTHIPLGATPSSAFLRSPISFIIKNWEAYHSGLEILDSVQPDVVIGLGGFASVPVVLGAWKRTIPILLLEQNAVMGRANQLLLPLSQSICLSFADTPLPDRYKTKAKVTGNPVREELLSLACSGCEPQDCAPTLLIMGGSQGAAAVNEAALKVLPQIKNELADWTIVHQTGDRQHDFVREEYNRLGIPAEVTPFLDDIRSIYHRTKLVISRAGATSLAEFASCGIASLLIPYPNSVRDHQKRNAEHYANLGGAILIEQSFQTVDVLSRNLQFLLTDLPRCDVMGKAMSLQARPEAAREIANLALSLSRTGIESGTTNRPLPETVG